MLTGKYLGTCSTGHVSAADRRTARTPNTTHNALLDVEWLPGHPAASSATSTTAPTVQPVSASFPPVQPVPCPRIPILLVAAADVVAEHPDDAMATPARSPAATCPAAHHGAPTHQRAAAASPHGHHDAPRQDRRFSNRGYFNANTSNKYHQEG